MECCNLTDALTYNSDMNTRQNFKDFFKKL